MNERKDIIKTEEAITDQGHQRTAVLPVVDIYENDDEIILYADMPGVVKENVTVNVDNGKLSISGVRDVKPTGAITWEEFGDVEYIRTFSVPQTIDIAKVNAELNSGVLKLHLPKSEAVKPRQIVIH